MNIIFKRLFFFTGCLLLFGACQGPWDYWPDDDETFRGIYAFAPVIEGRQVNVCFTTLLDLDENLSNAFAFYDSAFVQVSGTWSDGSNKALSLNVNPDYPNCFVPADSIYPVRGSDYGLKATFKWDSSGTEVISNLSASTYVPESYKLKNILAPNVDGSHTVVYSDSAPADFTWNLLETPFDFYSFYFVSDYDERVNSVLMVLEYDRWNGGESENTTLNKLLSSFSSETVMTNSYADSSTQLAFTKNVKVGTINFLDTISVVAAAFCVGKSTIYFYAADSNYTNYVNTIYEGNSDARVIATSNVEGGSGYFSGMSLDSVSLEIIADSSQIEDVKTYANEFFKSCRESNWDNKACRLYLYEACENRSYDVEECYAPAVKVALDSGLAWASLLPENISETEKNTAYIDGVKRYCISNGFPTTQSECAAYEINCIESADSNTCKEVLWNWCSDRNWPLDSASWCKSALVSYYRLEEINSSVIEREVETICEENPEEPQCGF